METPAPFRDDVVSSLSIVSMSVPCRDATLSRSYDILCADTLQTTNVFDQGPSGVATSAGGDLTGRLSWPGARLLASWLSVQQQLRRQEGLEQTAVTLGNSVVELGCGAGLVAAALANVAAPRQLVITDGDPKVLILAEQTMKLNASPNATADCRIYPLQWGDLDAADRLIRSTLPENGTRRFDSVVAADCVYPHPAPQSHEVARSLFATAARLLAGPADAGQLLLAHVCRNEAVDTELVKNAFEGGRFVWRRSWRAEELLDAAALDCGELAVLRGSRVILFTPHTSADADRPLGEPTEPAEQRPWWADPVRVQARAETRKAAEEAAAVEFRWEAPFGGGDDDDDDDDDGGGDGDK